MALINFLQLADSLDFNSIPVQNVWQAQDDITSEIFTMYFDLGTIQTDVESQMEDADSTENPQPDTITPAPNSNQNQFRNLLITDYLLNWATLTNEEKRILVRNYVYPITETTANLDLLYTQVKRDKYLSDTVAELNDSGENFQTAPDGKCWNILPDVAGSLVTTELKPDGVI